MSLNEVVFAAIEAERKAVAARCAEIAESLKEDRFGKLPQFQVADAIRAEFEL